MPVCSTATPIISSAAAFLLDEIAVRKAHGATQFQNAAKPVVIKSILQTGANKLPGWSKGDPADPADDEIHPLDFQQGAGQLDLDHSEQILACGASSPGLVLWTGWTYETVINPGEIRIYYFALNDTAGKRLAATLNWHRKIAPTGVVATLDTATLANLQLELYSYSANGFTPVQASRSPVDNLQHLHLPQIEPGVYVLCVRNAGSLPTDYALSWATLPQSESAIAP
jgi:hypothetical protein